MKKLKMVLGFLVVITGTSLYISINNLLVFSLIHDLPIVLSLVVGLLVFYIYLKEEPFIIKFLNGLVVLSYIGLIVLLSRYIFYRVKVGEETHGGQTIIVEEDILGTRYYYRKNSIFKEEV